ncbi:MAG: DUF4040 domain-containing protein [Anaerolineae bacterium]|nr:DUF4040 domain-containing protein [Anaerolineae bacterium]
MTLIQVGIILFLLLVCAAFAVFSKSLMQSVVALGACSFLAALFFFLYQANIAAIFELSVGAGLMSVLMIIAISLVHSIRDQKGSRQ